MKSLLYLLGCICLIAVSGCQKSDEPAINALVFGTHYGQCGINCVKMYRLTNFDLQKDGKVQHLTNYTDYTFTGTKIMDVAQFDSVRYLLNEIPSELLLTNNKAFGCPDCHDQGGMYIEVNKINGTTRYNIDLDSTGDQSAAIISFKKKVMNALYQLN